MVTAPAFCASAREAYGAAAAAPCLSTTKRFEKSTLPRISPMGGMMTSATRDCTMEPKAAPMMMPTAMSTTFPRMANSLNSLSIALLFRLELTRFNHSLRQRSNEARQLLIQSDRLLEQGFLAEI